MRPTIFLVSFCLIWLQLDNTVGEDGLFVASFNIRKFGRSKVKNSQNVDIITRIILKYDLLFLQEIVDKSGTAIKKLMRALNQRAEGDGYNMVLSKRVGREQYAYIYKNSKLKLLKAKLYRDHLDVFAREPLLAVFSTESMSRLRKLAVIGIHTRPKTARYEIANLTRVYSYVKWWGDTDTIIMGDLNADCSYFPKYSRKINPLYIKKTYKWLIDDDIDTTANLNTFCAYDRFILAGRQMKKSYVPQSAAIFNFSAAYDLDYRRTLAVSDHYPIEMRLH